MFPQIPMMTALHLNAALDALRPVMAQALATGDGVAVLLLEGLSQQIQQTLGRLPGLDENEDEFDPGEADLGAGTAASPA